MSAIEIVCAVASPCSGVISSWPSKWALGSFRLSSSRAALLGPSLAACSVRQKATRQQFSPIAAISVFLGGLNFGAVLCWPWVGSGSMSAVAYQLATPFTVLLAWPMLAGRDRLSPRPPECCLHSLAWSCWRRPGLSQTRFRCCLWSEQPSLSRVQHLDETVRPF